MGCDIHVLVQKRDHDCWLTVEPGPSLMDDGYPVYEDRSEVTFGMLAGVRNDTLPPISEPKGIPDDLRERTVSTRDWGGGPSGDLDVDDKYLGNHSHSWLTLAEIDAYGPPDGTTIAPLLTWMRTLGFPEDVRIVFGFDN